MSKISRAPKVIDGVVFAWVAEHKFAADELTRAFWMSVYLFDRTVRVFEPREGEEEWEVVLFHNKTEYAIDTYAGTQKIAWQKAVEFAKATIGK